jgi:hypothetical protein
MPGERAEEHVGFARLQQRRLEGDRSGFATADDLGVREDTRVKSPDSPPLGHRENATSTSSSVDCEALVDRMLLHCRSQVHCASIPDC